MKTILTIILMTSFFAIQAQDEITIEQTVADSACACFSALDSSQISSAKASLKSKCLQEAIQKNQENITKNYETEQRKDDQLQKEGIQGSMLIKVQNILSQSCPNYILFEKRLQVGRGTPRKRR
jgi:hypothetical protein